MHEPSGLRCTLAAVRTIAALALASFLLVSGFSLSWLNPATPIRFHGSDVSTQDLGGPVQPVGHAGSSPLAA